MKINTVLLTMTLIVIQGNVSANEDELSSFVIAKTDVDKIKVTDNQARVLHSLNDSLEEPAVSQLHKTVRLTITKLKDNQGQEYIGALMSRAELTPYLATLAQLLGDEFKQYRALQAARDHQLFHLTLITPPEYQLADKNLVAKLFTANANNQMAESINVSLLGLGKVAQNNKQTFFVVAQSGDAQLIRQQFLLPAKDFHITLGFSPSDIYGVKKDLSTLIKL